MKTVEQVLDGGQHVAIPQASANIEGMAPRRRCHTAWRGRQQDSAIGTIDRAQWRASTFADRRQASCLAKEPARTHWPTAPGAALLRTLGIERVFGREGR
jgi:hypothetical protein